MVEEQQNNQQEISEKEKRIRNIASLYYSRKDIQKAIFDFSENREIVPRYFEGFGKRPDSFQYPSDILAYVNKGATSFHCSQELWQDPLLIQTGMSQEQLNNLRLGWDFLIDIDSRYFDYSKIMGKLIIEALDFHGVKNVGVKFSGSKGLHIIIPSKAFPEEINGLKTSYMFPDWPRAISMYISEMVKKQLIEEISKFSAPNKYIKDFEAPKEVMPDLVLVSSRHLFRMPYSLHEKTSLASVVIDKSKIQDFELKDANPLNVKLISFLPEAKKNEAKELLVSALDWFKEKEKDKEKTKSTGKQYAEITLKNISENLFPPCIKNIYQGLADGRKRALFILINFYRSLNFSVEDIEKKVYEWNKKNKPPLKEGYIKSQLSWTARNKKILPPNCDKDYYAGIGVCAPNELCGFEAKTIKNPVNYVVRKVRRNERK